MLNNIAVTRIRPVATAAVCLALVGGGLWAVLAWGADGLQRQQLRALTPVEKEALAEKRTRFEALPAAEQARLRRLHQGIAHAPNSEELLSTVDRYYEWLTTLGSDQRAQLLTAPREQRVDMIRRLLEEQEQQRFRRLADQRLSPDDLQLVYQWTTRYIRSKESRLIELLPPDRQREVTEIDDEPRRWRTMFWLLRSHDIPETVLPSPLEIEELVSSLSSEAQQIFAAAADQQQRTELVQRWIRASMFSRLIQAVTNEQLMDFMQNELDPRMRARLEAMPREAMENEVRRHYMFHRFRGFGGGPPRFGPPEAPPPRGEERPKNSRSDRERQ